jgi:hypothetical protein
VLHQGSLHCHAKHASRQQIATGRKHEVVGYHSAKSRFLQARCLGERIGCQDAPIGRWQLARERPKLGLQRAGRLMVGLRVLVRELVCKLLGVGGRGRDSLSQS